jgi:hypothetical protein
MLKPVVRSGEHRPLLVPDNLLMVHEANSQMIGGLATPSAIPARALHGTNRVILSLLTGPFG